MLSKKNETQFALTLIFSDGYAYKFHKNTLITIGSTTITLENMISIILP